MNQSACLQEFNCGHNAVNSTTDEEFQELASHTLLGTYGLKAGLGLAELGLRARHRLRLLFREAQQGLARHEP
jgi:hypothetical protein